jgi:hypothetical protein
MFPRNGVRRFRILSLRRDQQSGTKLDQRPVSSQESDWRPALGFAVERRGNAVVF